MTIGVRPATDADRPVLRALFLHARRVTFDWLPAEQFHPGDFDAQTRGERILVAEDEAGAVTGFVSVWEPDAFIHHLFVAPERQREGIGHALLCAAGWPREPLRLKCLVRNERALAFYRAHGFAEAGRGSTDDGEYVLLESGHV